MQPRIRSHAVVRIDKTAYYMHSPPVRKLTRFAADDDVWSSSFLASVVIQSNISDGCSLPADVEQHLTQQGTSNIFFALADPENPGLPEGPYFLNHGSLHQAYRLYPDTSGAFIVATVPEPSQDGFRSLDAAAYGEEHPSSLSVAVPSRLYYTKTDTKPFAGLRVAIKDIMDLKGLKTGASSRAYTSLYPARSETAETVQRLIDLGFVVVGKLKSTQFADSEWPTCDWVDYHGPFNPKGDGYLTTSGSSAGSASAVASYKWLDFALGTDTLGSIRAPAAAQGVFGMRPSQGATALRGLIPYSTKFDTIGGFARTAREFRLLAQALYGSGPPKEAAATRKPTKLLYPVDFWTVSHRQSQEVFDEFIRRLETFLGVERTVISIGRLWNKTSSNGATSLTGYLEHAFEWAANPDQWSGFLRDFVEDYETQRGVPPALNPQLRFKRDYLPTVTASQQAEAVERLDAFREWFYENVMPPSQDDGYSESIMVLPWTDGVPVYRDTYKHGPQQFTGRGFFFYNIGPYIEAPEMIVPVRPTHYISKHTGRVEELPAAVSLMGSKGSDIMLAELSAREPLLYMCVSARVGLRSRVLGSPSGSLSATSSNTRMQWPPMWGDLQA
ncbi:amidase signature domain-containing protein [Lasiosphaeris hirsuta]|uniref:Amidase signature domain-containing protein n=1 Tax=Lasiosphaeris hirsuta TaxID=260670 RepID=A0AA40BD86_9PEZI|nr:amidase signature domain-containing protein [Lasiosphaeris hirsuta]